jgi:hypothetical protein
MRREEIDRLLARLSSGELTPGEREALYNAALDDQALFEEIFAEQALAEALEDETLRDEFLIREGKRERALAAAARSRKWRIPWWGWAVPAAVAVSTVLGVFLLKEPASEASVAQTVAKKPVGMAQARPAAATPAQAVQPASAPAAEALNALKKSTAQAAPQSPAAPAMMEESKQDFAAVRDAKDEGQKEKATGVAGGVPSATVGGVVGGISGRVYTDKPAVPVSVAEADARTAPARPAEAKAEQSDQGRSTESETRLAMRRDAAESTRQSREAPAAAPPVLAEKRAGAVGGARNEATASLAAKSALDESGQMAAAPVLQALGESGQWSNADRSRPLSRKLKLRLKLVSHDDGVWELLGVNSRTVTLKRGETGFVDLPSYGPGAQAVELAFRPSDASAQRFRSNSTPALARVRISFTIE